MEKKSSEKKRMSIPGAFRRSTKSNNSKTSDRHKDEDRKSDDDPNEDKPRRKSMTEVLVGISRTLKSKNGTANKKGFKLVKTEEESKPRGLSMLHRKKEVKKWVLESSAHRGDTLETESDPLTRDKEEEITFSAAEDTSEDERPKSHNKEEQTDKVQKGRRYERMLAEEKKKQAEAKKKDGRNKVEEDEVKEEETTKRQKERIGSRKKRGVTKDTGNAELEEEATKIKKGGVWSKKKGEVKKDAEEVELKELKKEERVGSRKKGEVKTDSGEEELEEETTKRKEERTWIKKKGEAKKDSEEEKLEKEATKRKEERIGSRKKGEAKKDSEEEELEEEATKRKEERIGRKKKEGVEKDAEKGKIKVGRKVEKIVLPSTSTESGNEDEDDSSSDVSFEGEVAEDEGDLESDIDEKDVGKTMVRYWKKERYYVATTDAIIRTIKIKKKGPQPPTPPPFPEEFRGDGPNPRTTFARNFSGKKNTTRV